MPAALIPLNETSRLESLRRADVLDTESEEFFEDIVDAVQQAIGAPIALVSLVDETRQWFKARRGVAVAETHRDYAFCAHAILESAPLLVPDAREDARFRDNPLVIGAPNVIAYAGAPIVLLNGARLGTVSVIDHVPRHWAPEQVVHLERCARLVARYLDARGRRLEQDRQHFLEMALARAESRYESLTRSMSEGMVIQGPGGAIIDSNPAAWAILGLTEDELYGRVSKDPRWRAINAAGEDFPGEHHPSMVALRTGQPQYGGIVGVEAPNCGRRWLCVNAYPVRRPSDGRVDQVVVTFRIVQSAGGLEKWIAPAGGLPVS